MKWRIFPARFTSDARSLSIPFRFQTECWASTLFPLNAVQSGKFAYAIQLKLYCWLITSPIAHANRPNVMMPLIHKAVCTLQSTQVLYGFNEHIQFSFFFFRFYVDQSEKRSTNKFLGRFHLVTARTWLFIVVTRAVATTAIVVVTFNLFAALSTN